MSDILKSVIPIGIRVANVFDPANQMTVEIENGSHFDKVRDDHPGDLISVRHLKSGLVITGPRVWFKSGRRT